MCGQPGQPACPSRAIYNTLKNLFEVKAIKSARLEGNLFDGTWSQAQSATLVIPNATPRQNGYDFTLQDVGFRFNRISNTPSAITMGEAEAGYRLGDRLRIEHNLFDTVIKLRKELEFLLTGNLDEENVIRAQEANIAKALIDELIVGENVQMGSNAYISWNNVENKPVDLLTQPQLIDALTDYVTTGEMSDALANTLNTGNFSTIITKDYIASMNLIVGQEILMGTNARISWLNVDDKPNIPTLPTYIQSTYIDSTNVISPFISGGTLTGALFRTASGDYQRIELDPNGLTSYVGQSVKCGVAINNGDYGYGRIDIYDLNSIVFSLYYNMNYETHLQPQSGCELHVWDVKGRGAWDLSGCTSLTGVDQIKAVFG
jgi:hypothetical protein